MQQRLQNQYSEGHHRLRYTLAVCIAWHEGHSLEPRHGSLNAVDMALAACIAAFMAHSIGVPERTAAAHAVHKDVISPTLERSQVIGLCRVI